jgi:ABC-type polysaccharide/polyol phosphate export permease
MTAATASTGSCSGATLSATSEMTSSVSQTSTVVKEEELSSDIAVVEQSAEEKVMHACSNIAVYMHAVYSVNSKSVIVLVLL